MAKYEKLPIVKMEIYDLFYKMNNISVDFEKEIKIYVAYNGSGKTTVLKIINSVLLGDIEKILNIEFSKIKLKLKNGKKIEIINNNLNMDFSDKEHNLDEVMDIFNNESDGIKNKMFFLKGEFNDEIFKKDTLSLKNRIFLREYVKNKYITMSDESIERYQELINRMRDYKILFLPTYRRVEEDISLIIKNSNFLNEFSESVFGMRRNMKTSSYNLYKSLNFGEVLNFGMRDIQEIFDTKCKEIRDSALDCYNKSFAKFLNNSVEQKNTSTDNEKFDNKDIKTIELILKRLNASELNEETKSSLTNIKFVNDDLDNNLKGLLKIMINEYSGTEEVENEIGNFCTLINTYFNNKLPTTNKSRTKKIEYNPETVTISIKDPHNEKGLLLNNLSFGEKQIVSLFVQIFFNKKKLIILIDEPELSMSVEWQEALLTDIAECEKVSHVTAMTHSPFIFKNLSKNTTDLEL